MNKLTTILSLILCSYLLTACGDSKLTEKPPVSIAEPRAYDAVTDAQLGTNENGKGLAPGTVIDGISLRTINDKPYELAQAWQQQPALIIFYRGGWCPYCNAQVRELSQNYEKFRAAGVQAVLISVDAPDRAALVGNAYNIPFPVLSDPQLLAHFAFNVALELDAPTLEQYKSFGIVPADWSSAKHNTIAVASAFIVDRQGVVRFSHAPADYRSRPSADQLLAMVKLLNF